MFGPDCVSKFICAFYELSDVVNTMYENVSTLKMSPEAEAAHNAATVCSICEEPLAPEDKNEGFKALLSRLFYCISMHLSPG